MQCVRIIKAPGLIIIPVGLLKTRGVLILAELLFAVRNACADCDRFAWRHFLTAVSLLAKKCELPIQEVVVKHGVRNKTRDPGIRNNFTKC